MLATFLRAYRHQYILSGVENTRFAEILKGMITEQQLEQVVANLAQLR